MGRQRVLGVLAGTDINAETIAVWAQSADVVVAADGAANRMLASGVTPDIVIGDLDSLEPEIRASGLDIREDQDQETTDCDKLLLFVNRTYPKADFALIGMEGDRFDHVLGSLQSAGRLKPGVRVVLRDGFGFFVTDNRPIQVRCNLGQLISLIPLLPCEGVLMSGVQWTPKENLSPLGATSISNVASDTTVTAQLESGLAMFIQQADTSQPSWD